MSLKIQNRVPYETPNPDWAHFENVGTKLINEDLASGRPLSPNVLDVLARAGWSGIGLSAEAAKQHALSDNDAKLLHTSRDQNGRSFARNILDGDPRTDMVVGNESQGGGVPTPPENAPPQPSNRWYPVGHPRSEAIAKRTGVKNGPLELAMRGFEETHTGIGPTWLVGAAASEFWLADATSKRKLEEIIQRIQTARMGPDGNSGLLLVHDAIIELEGQGKNVVPEAGQPYTPPEIIMAKRKPAQMACDEVWYGIRDLWVLCRSQPPKRWVVSSEYAFLGRYSFQYSNLYRGCKYILDAMTLACGMIGLRGEFTGRIDPVTGEKEREAEYADSFVFDDPSIEGATSSAGIGTGVGGGILTGGPDDIPRPV